MNVKEKVIAAVKSGYAKGTTAAVLGYILGEKLSTPEIIDMQAAGSTIMFGMTGECGVNHFLGSSAELRKNIRGFAKFIGLSPAEQGALMKMVPARLRNAA